MGRNPAGKAMGGRRVKIKIRLQMLIVAIYSPIPAGLRSKHSPMHNLSIMIPRAGLQRSGPIPGELLEDYGLATDSRLKGDKGFTLVELLVVLAVLAILFALVYPAVRQMIEKGVAVKCANNMRQIGVALWAYRADHNNWFPPGHPKHPNTTLNLNNNLVPTYIGQLPICPATKRTLTAVEKNKYGTVEEFYRQNGGNYGINGVLTQWKVEAMPWPSVWDGKQYRLSHMPLLLEVAIGSSTWVMNTHINQALQTGRHHGGGDTMNFLFLDGHMELIKRNDPRDVPESDKAWNYPTNPNGKFQNMGGPTLYIQPSQMGQSSFETYYPDIKS